MRQTEETKKALIAVRTYPTPTEKGVESSCTAAISEGGEWLRLFPVRYRYLPPDQRSAKYQWVEVTVTKANDPRPESYTPKHNSFKILTAPLSTANAWRERKDAVYPLAAHCLCCLQKACDQNGYPTLGFFRPKFIEQLRIVESLEPRWTQKQLAILRQKHLFEESPRQELEKIPFSFYYYFKCDDAACNGHRLSCTDWEMGESYRRWRKEYGEKWEEKFRQRYETEMIQKYETHFFVGTLQQYPGTWIIIGLFYPARSATATLF